MHRHASVHFHHRKLSITFRFEQASEQATEQASEQLRQDVLISRTRNRVA